jgi:hypothetical protein
MQARELERIAYQFRHGRPDGMEFSFTLNFDLSDMDRFLPKQRDAIFRGIAACIAAGHDAPHQHGEAGTTVTMGQEMSGV